ncbi:hypothetical protein H2204_005138 [Knufia peltigerae]|uniref:Zn(2)-C6 fungal-type domain-containing protein n=1 Tax=Knufia peltigerae TaxID=1002370 RepID=A0AA38Y684_9EURO|nr:hypothetical protein H2204_005138 [Knufia peltigerae]
MSSQKTRDKLDDWAMLLESDPNIDRRKCSRQVLMQILSLGGPRTGTLSNGFGLQSPWHTFKQWMPNITQTADGQASHNANFDQLLGHVGTTTDTPTNQTKAAYPETKVVLVERDEEKWLKSIQMQFSEALKPAGSYGVGKRSGYSDVPSGARLAQSGLTPSGANHVVLCDENRPSCGLCAQRGVECVYNDGLSFIFANFDSQSTTLGRTPMAVSRQKSPVRETLPASPVDLPQPCLVTSHCLQIHGAFLGIYLPQSCTAVNPSPAVTTGWLRAAYELSSTDQLLSDAFSALSIQCLGRHDDLEGKRRSQMLRGRVMRNLSRRIGSGSRALEDTTLACVMMLNFVESQSANSKGASGWLFHAQGVSALIKARGAKNHESSFGQQLFLGSRLMDLVGAIGTRKATETLHHLCSIPSLDPRCELTQLFDILHALPSTLEKLDIVVGLTSEGRLEEVKATTHGLIETCHNLIIRLRDWRTLLDVHNADAGNGQLVWEEPSDLYRSLPVDSPLRIFPTYFCFPNLDIAQQILLYMVGKVFLWTVIFAMEDVLEGMLPQHQTSSCTRTRSSGAEASHECRLLAIQVAQSFEYFVRPDMGLTAIDLFGFPVSFICNWLTERAVPERLWFRVLFNRLRTMNPGYTAFLESATKLHGECDIFELLQ